ncbi:MAG: NTP transferase domain-containing protein, partial [Propionibacteriaceae bacterium]|nr:NTP transferase domain-containing protein [Propionibacteriaceae bacterium]
MNASSDELAVAIVVAAGSGRRLGRDLPKAAVEVAGWPMVVRSVRAMFLGGVEQVVVVAPTDQQQAFA